MKITKCFSLIVVTCLMFHNNIFAQRVEVTWDYPVKPGMEEWKNLRSHMDMVSSCQMPDDILSKISTEKLVQICLDYPLFFVITAFNNMQEGFDQISNEFNGLNELIRRKDAGKELLIVYSNYDAAEYKKEWTLLEIGLYMQRLFFMEVLLSQPDILNDLNAVEIRSLLTECLIKIDQKKSSNYGSFSFMTTPLLIARVLKTVDQSELTLKISNDKRYRMFVNMIFPVGSATYDDIQAMAENYLK